jgi:hypothetical protein
MKRLDCQEAIWSTELVGWFVFVGWLGLCLLVGWLGLFVLVRWLVG